MDALLLVGVAFVTPGLSTPAGMFLLPSHHLNTGSKDVIRLATAIVGTLAVPSAC